MLNVVNSHFPDGTPDMGGLEVNADGNFNVDVDGTNVPTTVTGHIKIKLGQTYPYLGVAYGYDYESVVHLEASLGVYLVKKPEVDLDFIFGVPSGKCGFTTLRNFS